MCKLSILVFRLGYEEQKKSTQGSSLVLKEVCSMNEILDSVPKHAASKEKRSVYRLDLCIIFNKILPDA